MNDFIFLGYYSKVLDADSEKQYWVDRYETHLANKNFFIRKKFRNFFDVTKKSSRSPGRVSNLSIIYCFSDQRLRLYYNNPEN